MRHPVPHLGTATMNTVVDWMATVIADRFGTERGVAERGYQMRVDVQRRMRRNHHATLLRIVRDAQRLGEAGGAGRIKLHEADRAGIDEVADRVAMPFAFAMRQRNW